MANAATATVKTIKRDVPFSWEGVDKKGNRVKGKDLAADEQGLRQELRRRGIIPNKVAKQLTLFNSTGGKVKAEEIAIFSRQLATMMAAGIRCTPLSKMAMIRARWRPSPRSISRAMPARSSGVSAASPWRPIFVAIAPSGFSATMRIPCSRAKRHSGAYIV